MNLIGGEPTAADGAPSTVHGVHLKTNFVVKAITFRCNTHPSPIATIRINMKKKTQKQPSVFIFVHIHEPAVIKKKVLELKQSSWASSFPCTLNGSC